MYFVSEWDAASLHQVAVRRRGEEARSDGSCIQTGPGHVVGASRHCCRSMLIVPRTGFRRPVMKAQAGEG